MRRIILLAAFVVFAFSHYADAAIIIKDTFSRTGTLAGSSPDISLAATTWNVPGGAPHTTDGSVLNIVDANARANIAFNLVAGRVYTLSADVESNGVVDNVPNRDWLGLGFTSNVNGGSPFHEGIHAWMLLRPVPEGSPRSLETWAGPDLTDIVIHDLTPVTNAGQLKVVLDTTNPSNYAVEWFFDGVSLRTANIGNPAITGVFLSNLTNGTVDNFMLSDDISVIPEPTTLVIWSLLATLGLSFYRRRRRRA